MSHTPTRVLITGATSGIGRHAALHLARLGYRVFATGRRPAALAELAREAEGTDLATVQLDVTDPSSIEGARQAVDRATGGDGVDVLINNAGFGIAGPTLAISDEDLRAQFETNLFGLMAVTRAFVPAMMERRAGRVINVSSVGGRFTTPFFGAYNATKYALEAMSDALRNELHPFGVRVVVVEPGAIKTNFGEVSMGWIDRYRSPDSPYAPVFKRADALKAQFDRSAASPEVISRAIERAIRARRPAARYVAPLRYRFLLAFLGVLPTSWTDAVVRRAFGFSSLSPTGVPAFGGVDAPAGAAPAEGQEAAALH